MEKNHDDEEDDNEDGAAPLPNAIVRLNNPVLERNRQTSQRAGAADTTSGFTNSNY